MQNTRQVPTFELLEVFSRKRYVRTTSTICNFPSVLYCTVLYCTVRRWYCNVLYCTTVVVHPFLNNFGGRLLFLYKPPATKPCVRNCPKAVAICHHLRICTNQPTNTQPNPPINNSQHTTPILVP